MSVHLIKLTTNIKLVLSEFATNVMRSTPRGTNIDTKSLQMRFFFPVVLFKLRYLTFVSFLSIYIESQHIIKPLHRIS